MVGRRRLAAKIGIRRQLAARLHELTASVSRRDVAD
jgi:hypothetical protein